MSRAAPAATGSRWEALALAHLEAAGLRLRTRNFRCRLGELDLVMDEADTLVFIEVRYRRSPGFGGGIESVTAAKRQRLVQAASLYLAVHPALATRPCRFDVIAVSGSPGQPRFDWRRGAFDAA